MAIVLNISHLWAETVNTNNHKEAASKFQKAINQIHDLTKKWILKWIKPILHNLGVGYAVPPTA